VDSEDLPLNVSREMLQHNPLIEKMKKGLVSKILSTLAEIAASDPQKYLTFWQQFGPVFKEGLHTDSENKEKLLELVRFQSSMGATKDDLVSLKQYVGRMREDQKEIYYISGDSREIVEKSPHLEIFRDKSVEVLYLIDPIDEWIVNDIYNFESKKLTSVTKGELNLGNLDKDDKKEADKAGHKVKKLCERMKNILADAVKDVRVTSRLKDSPACLVADEHDMGGNMEKIMRAMGQAVPESKRILEINPSHPIVGYLNALYEQNATDERLNDGVRLVYEQAIIAEGQSVPDPLGYSKRVNALLSAVLASCIVPEKK
jgi:molecular chaperone HtpG